MIKQIQEIMDNFDFERVKKVMKFLQWDWGADVGIPNINDIKNNAKRLLLEAIERGQKNESNYCCLRSGGFSATYDNESLFLDFIIEEWWVEKDEEDNGSR